METPSRYTFAPDGSTNVFQIPVQMKGDNYVRIDIDDITVNDRNKYDIVNNSIVFVNITDVPAGSKLDILVVQTDEGISNLGNVNAVDTVSQNILSVNTVATNIAAVVNNSNNIAHIQAVSANMPAVVNAVQAATNAAASEAAAEASENASKASENASKASEVAAENHKDGAAASATAANTSLSNTLAAKMVAIQASADADTSKNAAQVSETNAASEAATATTKASEASASAAAAATSATNAATSETNAAASASSAQASKDAALAALDNFDDRYLGQKTSDPATDNDGAPLISGTLYFNTTDGIMKVYEGSLWVAAYASLSGAMLVANNLSDVTSASDSRNNLGLGAGDTPTFAGLTTTSDVLFGDNDKAIFGAANDLEIDADSITSRIAATGFLEIVSPDMVSLGGAVAGVPNMLVDPATGTLFLDSTGATVAFIPNSGLAIESNVDLNVTGTVDATAFVGDGSGLTGITAGIPSPAGSVDGDLLVRSSGAWARLPKGTADQVLTINAGATAPEWADVTPYLPAAGGLGSLCFAYYTGADVGFGTAVAGSLLAPTSATRSLTTTANAAFTATFLASTALSGTWRCLGYFDSFVTVGTGGQSPQNMTLRGATLWQRIL